MHTQLKADLMLVLVTFFWGISYLLTDLALTEVGVFSLNAIRFLLAFVVGGLCFLPRLRHPSAATLKTALATGAALFCVYTATTFGVKYTSLSNAGFLCALPVVFTPLLDFLFFRRRPSRKLALVLVMAVTGIALLTLSDDLRPALGDVLCILCALSNAVYLIITERAVARPEVDAFQLGVYQQLVTGLGMLVLSVFLAGALPVLHRGRLPDPVGGPPVHHRLPCGGHLLPGAGVQLHLCLLRGPRGPLPPGLCGRRPADTGYFDDGGGSVRPAPPPPAESAPFLTAPDTKPRGALPRAAPRAPFYGPWISPCS